MNFWKKVGLSIETVMVVIATIYVIVGTFTWKRNVNTNDVYLCYFLISCGLWMSFFKIKCIYEIFKNKKE